MMGKKQISKKWVPIAAAVLLLAVFAAPKPAYAACTNPAGEEGKIVYNTTYGTMQYCDDTSWISMGATTAPGGNNGPTDGLVARWKLDESSGSTVAADMTGLHNATLTNMNTTSAWISGIRGGALLFDGSNDYLTTPDTATLDLSSFSLTTWVRFDGAVAANYFFEKGTAGQANYRFYLYHNGSNYVLACGFHDGTTWRQIEQTVGPSLGVWYHLACTWDNTAQELIMYVNGVAAGYGSGPFTPVQNNAALWLGRSQLAGAGTLLGAMDDARIYNRALSPAEVEEVLQSGSAPSHASLLGRWKFDESSGLIATDSSPNANIGTLGGGPTWQASGGRVNGALDFDGVDDTVIVYTHPVFNDINTLTVSAWIYPRGWGEADRGRIIDKRTGAQESFIFYLMTPGHLVFEASRWSGNNGVWGSSSAIIPLNTWTHVAVTYNYGALGNDPVLYVNGSPVGVSETTTPTGTVSAETANLNIGNDNGASRTFNGLLDDVRMYGRVLAADEVAALYENPEGGVCSNPFRAEGQIIFNSTSGVMQYCNGMDWISMGEVAPPAVGPCDTTPTQISATGTHTYNIPANCYEVTIQAFGAGGSGSLDSQGQRGGGGGGGATAAERASNSQLLVVGGGGGGGGGVDGSPETQSRGGGGGYASATVAVAPADVLNIWVGSGGGNASGETGGASGATAPYQGGQGGNRRLSGGGVTYGGGGGGGNEDTIGGAGVSNLGGNSTYGGAGGGGGEGGACGTSTNGGACSGVFGGGGGGFSISGGTVILGSAGNVSSGAAANGGPGNGAQNATGGNGRIILTPAAGTPPGGAGCSNPTGDTGAMIYNTTHSVMQYCNGNDWVGIGK
jgi:hypothetical protein